MIAFVATVLIDAAWQPVLIALIAWTALRVSRCSNATTRHAVWTIALIAAVAVPVVSAASIFSAPSHHVETVVAAPSSASATHAVPRRTRATTAFVPAPAASLMALERPTISVQPTIAQVVDGAWMVIALCILLRLAYSLATLQRLKHNALPLAVDVRNDLRGWQRAEKGARDVRICVTEDVDVPIAVGIFDAMILLPAELVRELSPDDLDRVVLHELAHVRRSDDWINLFERAALALFFFSPGVHWIARQMDLEREVACDDSVLANLMEHAPYARCLARIAERTAWPYRAAAAPGVFVTRRSMSIRIERMLAKGRDARVRLAVFPTGIAFVSIAAIVLAGAWVSPVIAYTCSLPTPAHSLLTSIPPAPRHVAVQRVRLQHGAATVPARDSMAAVALATAPPTAAPAQHPAAPAPRPAPLKPKSVAAPTVKKAPPARYVAASTPVPSERPTPSGGYLDELSAAGLTGLDADTVVEMRSVGVTGAYIQQMRDAGLTASGREFAELRSVGVTPDYVAGMRAAGVAASQTHEWIELKSVGVTADYANALRNAGYASLRPRDYAALKSIGVDAAYIAALAAHGFQHLPVGKLEEFKSLGVIP